MSKISYHALTGSFPDPFINPSPLNGLLGRKKIAILGFEEKNNRTAPYDDVEWECWNFNMFNRMGYSHDEHGRFRCDRAFDLHEEHAQSELDMAWINQCPCPIYLPTLFGANPQARIYPLQEVEAWLLREFSLAQPYWASSFAYAIVLAMYQGATTIGLFGVSLDWGRERIVERGNLEFYIGLALGSGIKIIRSPGSKLLTHPARYGIEYEAERNQVIEDCGTVVRQLAQGKEFKAAIDAEFQERITALERVRDETLAVVHNLLYMRREPIQDQERHHNDAQ